MKREFLELLDRDIEFRYAVAGYLGLSEILKRLDAIAGEQTRLAEEQINLRKEQARLAEEQTKIWNEIRALREEQTKIWVEIERFREEQIRLREDMITGFKRHDEEQARLREDFNKMYRQMDARLTRVERTLEKITVDIEDEARIIVKHRLREMGYEVEVGRAS
ncbi:MAG: hypothetical protein QW093_06275 [Candidatus Bathyarchaeia archaeon]